MTTYNRSMEIRFEQDDTRLSPGRLTGTLLTYEQRAKDRPEIFARGALIWPDNGIVVNEQHDRKQAIIRATPFLKGDAVLFDFQLPDTARGRDVAVSVKNGTLTGLSVEFRSLAEGHRDGLRLIKSARLLAAGLVDSPSYAGSVVEVREQSGPYWQLDNEALLWL